MEKLNITKIARKLNLSKTTVSRVFNNRPHSGISPSTRQKVLTAIHEMGYEPNLSARALAGGKTHVIGAMMVNINNPFASGFVSSMETVAREAGYHVILCNSHGSCERECEEVRMLRQRGVEGLVIEHLGSADYLLQLRQAEYPFVLLDRCLEVPWADYVTFDDVEGGFLAAKALIEAGRKKIAHLTGPAAMLVTQDRLAGFKLALKTAGLPENPEWVIHAERFEDQPAGLVCARKLFDLPNRPDAVFCADDYLALGVLQAAAEHGLSVPQNLAVIGYNDLLFCPWTAVPLASVHLDTAELGRQAAELLLKKIETGSPSINLQAIKIPPKIVKRASLGNV